jgi:Grx4 family monothiol glutaredoxin
MPVTDVKTAAEFDALLASSPGGVVAHYWATWCEPCGAMDQLVRQLSSQWTGVAFARVEAEEVDELTERYDVSAVPFFTFHKGAGAPLDKLEGADGKALASKTQQHFGVASSAARAADGAAPVAGTQPTSDAGAGDLDARLRELTTRDPVVLFMKGDRGEPRCGFSRKVVEALNGTGVEYSTFDILQDEEVRQGLKTFSNWPTYPQLYAGGELLGGCDIVLEMAAGGELKAALGA